MVSELLIRVTSKEGSESGWTREHRPFRIDRILEQKEEDSGRIPGNLKIGLIGALVQKTAGYGLAVALTSSSEGI